ARPETAATGPTPDRIAPAGFAPSAVVTPFVALDTRLSNWSRISTSGGGVMTAPAVALPGGTRKTSFAAPAGFTVTLACCAMAVPPTLADTVLASATVELSVPLATPLVVVGPGGWVSVLPLPVAVSVTVFPPIGLPKPSNAVTVMVTALPPLEALIVLCDAVTVVRDGLTAPGREVARKFSGLPTPVAWTACVLSVAVIRVPSVHCVEARPLASVDTVVGATEPPPSITVQLTVTLATGLLKSSVTFTDNGTGSVAPTVSFCRSPPFLVRDAAAPTVAVAVNVTGLPVSAGAVAVSVFAPAVGPSVHDRTAATPSVPVMTGVVGSTVPLPVATAKLTETLLTGLPLA